MKRFLTLFFLLSIIVAGSSFKLKRNAHVEQFKNDGYLTAIIDGKSFQAREDNKYTAELMNKSAESNNLIASANGGKLTRVATMVNFYGSDFKDDDITLLPKALDLNTLLTKGPWEKQLTRR